MVDPFTSGVVRGGRVGIRLAELPETLLEGVVLPHAQRGELAWRQARIELLLGPGHRLLLDGFDLLGPQVDCLILRKVVFQVMDVA